MTLKKRISIVECDICHIWTEIIHEIEYEADYGYAFNKALQEAGWAEPFDKRLGYIHCCTTCTTDKEEK